VATSSRSLPRGQAYDFEAPQDNRQAGGGPG
jgi:hypothetical protein